MPTWSFSNRTRSTISPCPSSRIPAPLPSGTRARASVRSRTVMPSPRRTRIALPSHVRSVSTVVAPAPLDRDAGGGDDRAFEHLAGREADRVALRGGGGGGGQGRMRLPDRQRRGGGRAGEHSRKEAAPRARSARGDAAVAVQRLDPALEPVVAEDGVGGGQVAHEDRLRRPVVAEAVVLDQDLARRLRNALRPRSRSPPSGSRWPDPSASCCPGRSPSRRSTRRSGSWRSPRPRP